MDEVVRRSGLGQTTVYRVLGGDNQFKVRFETAALFAKAFGVPVGTIFRNENLSDQGRPPLTGSPLDTRPRKLQEIQCMHCFLMTPVWTGCCVNCDAAL